MNIEARQAELKDILSLYFGRLSDNDFKALYDVLVWKVVPAGETLFYQGDEASSMFIVVSGRLLAHIQTSEGTLKVIGHITKGETVGESAILTGKKRSASVTAHRDSVLVELNKDVFFHYAERSPLVLLEFAKILIQRLETRHTALPQQDTQINIAVMALTPQVSLKDLLEPMVNYLQQKQPCRNLNSALIAQELGFDYNDTPLSVEAFSLFSDFIYLQEQKCPILFYETDASISHWTEKCLRQTDVILLVADYQIPHLIDAQKWACISDLRAKNPDFPVFLALLHPDGTQKPQDTHKKWLDKIRPKQHFHIRTNLQTDLERLARSVSGRAIGLACGGGGAKGLAEYGVYKALVEHNIPFDYVAGVSFGSLVGASVASCWTEEHTKETIQKVFLKKNILGDYRLPLISISGGKYVTEGLRYCFPDNIEDMWLPFICHSSNLSTHQIELHTEGGAVQALRASLSIPGILPTVRHKGHFLIDGGIINNLPVDILHDWGCLHTIAIEVGDAPKSTQKESLQIPNNWDVLRHKIRKKELDFPLFMDTLEQAVMLSSAKHTADMIQRADVCFQPPVKHVRITDWHRAFELMEVGYRDAKMKIEAWGPQEWSIFS